MSSQVTTIGILLSSTWEQYKERAIPILAVVLISTAVIGGMVMIVTLCAVFGGLLLVHVEDTKTVTSILVATLFVVFLIIIILALWFQTAMLAIVIRKDLGIIEAFQTGWNYLRPMTWVLTIFSGILLTGFILGILPAVLCLVWFSFCFYILIEEDRRGLDSLLASMEYVKGYWWNTFGKLFVIWFISIIIGIVPFIGTVFTVLFYPFLMLFMLNMYRDLKKIKGEVEITAGPETRAFWWIVTWVGLILPVVALAGALLALLYGDNSWLELIQQTDYGVSI